MVVGFDAALDVTVMDFLINPTLLVSYFDKIGVVHKMNAIPSSLKKWMETSWFIRTINAEYDIL